MKVMKLTQLLLLIKKVEKDTPVIITWKDAVDYSDEVTIDTLKIKEVYYDTIGFFLSFKDV